MGIQGELRDHFLPQPSSFRKKREYALQEVLGRGGFGKVVRAVWTPPNGEKRDVALKIISKKLVQDPKAVMDEIDVLKGLDHPNIVHVWDHFESRDKYYLTFELATGGELFDRIQNRGKFTEKDAADCIRQVVSATAYLHAHKVVHRDLKPENILYRTREPDSQLVIADFGIARHLSVADEDGDGAGDGRNEENGELTEQAGSLGYAAPEVLRGVGHGARVDCWSIGVIAYMLLCGYPPFRLDSKQELIRETMKGRIHFHERFWRKVSDTAKDFIKKMLVVDPKQRMSAAEALRHPWLASGAASDHDLSSNLKENFNPRKKFVGAVRVVQATHRMRSASASTSSTPTITGLSVPHSITPLSTTDDEPDLTADESGTQETFVTAEQGHVITAEPSHSSSLGAPSQPSHSPVIARDHIFESSTSEPAASNPNHRPTFVPPSDLEIQSAASSFIQMEAQQSSAGQLARKVSGGSIPSLRSSGRSGSVPVRKTSPSTLGVSGGDSTNVRPTAQRRNSPGLLPSLGAVSGLKGMMGKLGLGGAAVDSDKATLAGGEQ